MTNKIEKALTNAIQEYTQKSRVYVDSPDDVPDKYEVQEGSRGGYYYETDGGSDTESGDDTDSDTLGDDATQEEIDEAIDTFESSIDSDDMTELRDEAMDLGYELVEERGGGGADDINESLEVQVEDMVWEEVEELQDQGEMPELDGHAFDEVAESVSEVTNQIMDVAAVDEQDIQIQTEGVDTDPRGF